MGKERKYKLSTLSLNGAQTFNGSLNNLLHKNRIEPSLHSDKKP